MSNLFFQKSHNKYYAVGTFPKSNNKKVQRGKLDTLSAYIHNRSLSWLNISTSIKSGSFKLVLWTQTSPLNAKMRSCKCFAHVSKMPTLTNNRANNVLVIKRKRKNKERYILKNYTWHLIFVTRTNRNMYLFGFYHFNNISAIWLR